MFKAPYDEKLKYDSVLEGWINHRLKVMEQDNDDTVFLIVGPTGGGKSTLGLHIYDIISKTPKKSRVCLTRQQFAKGHNEIASESKTHSFGSRDLFLGYDEQDLIARSSTSKWNKDMMRLYMTNRIFQGFHVWCNPSLEYQDKFFIQERVAGVFFVYKKSTGKPREYYFFSKKAIMRLYEQQEKLTQHILKKNAEAFADYSGWFRKYTGTLEEIYKIHKLDSAITINNEFFSNYADDTRQNIMAVAYELGIKNPSTIKSIKEALDAENLPFNLENAKKIKEERRKHMLSGLNVGNKGPRGAVLGESPGAILKTREEEKNANPTTD